MSYALQVFVSSVCYELRDLRAAINEWLTQHGLVPLMSDEAGFPHIDKEIGVRVDLKAVAQINPL